MQRMQEQRRLNLCMMKMNMVWSHCGHLIWHNIKVPTKYLKQICHKQYKPFFSF